MRLRNKNTGEIKDILDVIHQAYNERNEKLLMNLEKEWEDVSEEPKEYWCIDWTESGVFQTKYENDEMDEFNKSIGNYFVTKEEAEKAVEKLKALKRLKYKGFEFVDFKRLNDCACFIKATYDESWSEFYDDLNLLFGGEE